jgi:hypothetical protein
MSDYSYLGIADDEMLPGRPGKTSLFFRLRNDPLAVAQRDSGAPWLNGVGGSQAYSANGTFVVPAGVFRLRVIAVGGGGGGKGGRGDSGDGADGDDGGASGLLGDLFAPGGLGGDRPGWGNGGWRSNNGGRGGMDYQMDDIPNVSARRESGAGGEIRYKEFDVTPGDNLSIVVGAGGAGGAKGGISADRKSVV